MENDLLNATDFKECVDFHGHVCPGIAIGYRAAKAGMKRLEAERALDEELVAIVETDACGCDAIQVLTGCTFGKGNFIYRDYGKHAFTFFNRKTGKGVRAVMKVDALPQTEAQKQLSEKIRKGEATDEDKKRYSEMRLKKTADLLGMPETDLFDFKKVNEKMPGKAVVSASVLCDNCKEPTMDTKMENVGGKMLCRGCISKV